ncbi:hypothetical protein BDB00DRAFT_877099 [Zychaea mexicana]|uniref:uncharacterized protein n=1 Tax=Zychaea mexicana TaxID=64656 RepID=UPI0022FF34FE|nr:uncharacterized protein BDB00DRAFT_877099 [Zychaea mexicana]KAI9488741.1 hypothetical protein BDB00DRAFT_877099 [Zychaea mexicana]
MMKSKGWALAIIFCVFLYFCFSSLNAIAQSKSTQRSADIVIQRNNPYRRSNSTLLTSVLAHIKSGYVANRTPTFDTPPLLVLFSCRQPNACGSFEERLMSLTTAYVFALVWDGAAFGIDMDAPVKFDWYFEMTLGSMSMNEGQIEFYLDNDAIADQSTLLDIDSMSTEELQSTDFMAKYRQENVKILRCGKWDTWTALLDNPSVWRHRDKYQLQKLNPSEVFWVVHQILFRKPSSWLEGHLASYRDLMGGSMYTDPIQKPPVPDDSVQHRWMRVGIHLKTSIQEDIDCVAARAAFVCRGAQVMGKECHVFLSAPSQDIIQALQKAIQKRSQKDRRTIIHAVSESYEFIPAASMIQSPSVQLSEEQRVKLMYARPIMDWTILSRMDYLIGGHGDLFLKTAAAAAQVETGLYQVGSDEECKIEPMTSW